MDLFIWFLIGLVIIVLIIVLFANRGAFKSYAPPEVDPTELAQQYTPSNPWGINGGFDPSTIPVDGVDGQCNVYTFTSDRQWEPALVSFTSINSCLGGCISGRDCKCSVPVSLPCIDDDQLFAAKMTHTCQPEPTGWDIRTSGLCRKQDGTMVPPGTVEEYFTRCQPSSTGETNPIQSVNCKGSLSLIMFRVDIGKGGPTAFDDALCVIDPNDPSSPNILDNIFTTGDCDMSSSKDGIPRQLFRIERADWNGKEFKENQNGNFARIVHRPTNKLLSPSLGLGIDGKPSPLKPLIDEKVILIDRGAKDTYVWALIPQLKDPTIPSPTDPKRLIARSQIVYAPNPRLFPNFNDQASLWKFLTALGSNTLSMTPKKLPNSIYGLWMGGYVVTDSLGDEQTQRASKLAFGMYLDYSIVGIIRDIPQNYDFYGAFPP